MKKLLAIVISMAMIVAMMPMGVFAVTTDNCAAENCSHQAAIGTTHYDTLQEAVDAAGTGGIANTITLVKNVELTETLNLDKNIILDLNGYKISNCERLNNASYLVKVDKDADVFIVGNKEGSEIHDARSNPTGTITAICVLGKLTVEGDGLKISRGQNGIAIKVDEGAKQGELVVESGEISSTHAIQNWGISTIKGGVFKGKVDCYAYGNIGGKLTINNGVFEEQVYSAQLKYGGSWPAVSAKTSIAGGTFKKEIAEYYDDGTNGVQPVTRVDKPNEASESEVTATGGTFSDLSALDYLGDNAKVTVELAANKTLDKGFSILEGKEVTLDLGGKKLSRNNGYLFDVYGTLNIKNGTAEMTGAKAGAAIWLNKTANLTIDSNATVIANESEENNSSFAIGFYSDCTAANLVINGKLNGENGATVNGNITTAGNTVTVGKDAVIDVSGTGLYLAGVANTTVNGAKIKGGATAIEIRAGELTVNGGEFESTAEKYECNPNGNGTTTEGAALAIAQHTTKKDIKVTVNDGIFKGIKALNESNPQENDPAPQVTLAVNGGTFNGEVNVVDASKFITGGTFSKDPKAYVADGYVVTGNGPFTVGRPYTPSTPADNVTNNTTDKSTTADLTPAVKDNKAETTVDAKTADKIVDKAVANKSTEVIVDATGNNTVASSEVGIPEKTVKELAEKTDANLVIKTDNGKVDLDKTALAAVAEQAGTTGTVRLVVETVKTDENICHVNLKLVTSNGAVKDFKGGNVKVTINLTKELAAKELVCVYIDDNGIYTLVEGVLNADGTYTFTTGHFSEYAVMAKAEADKKIAEQLNTLIKEVNLKVRTSKTAKKNIKAVVSGDVKALTDAGYTVKYKFYRSEKKASKYVGKVTKTSKTYVNTAGKKGTKYYYKAKALVYDGDKLVGQTVLTQCKYGVRTWSK